MFERLGSDLPRDQIRVDVATGLPGWSNYVEAAGSFEQIRIASVGDRRLAGIEGHSVAELANRDHVDPLTFVFDLLVRDRAATVMIVELMHEDDVTAALRFPATGIGSDQLAVTGPDASVHPRCYGTFAKVLGTYVRERGVLAMAEAIHRMTGLAAEITNFQKLTLHRGRKQKTFSFSSKGHAEQMTAWTAFLQGKEPHQLPYDQARTSTLLTFAVLESIQQARSVEL